MPENISRPENFSLARPLKDRILVRLVTPPDKPGGIIIPEAAKSRPTTGEIVAVGPGRKNKRGELVPIQVSAGDKILFNRFAGDGEVDGFVMMREEDIIAVVEEAA